MAEHPIPIGSRGLRYLNDDDELDQDLAIFVAEELHKLSFDDTIAWYSTTYENLTDNQRAYLGCNDRFFLSTMLLDRHDVLHPWIFARFREVEAEPDGYLDLWSRYHFKSSIITQAGVIQEILIDPNITIAIISRTKAMAKVFFEFVRQALTNKGVLKRIYHDVLWDQPRKYALRWSMEAGLVVKRTVQTKEATCSAHGIIDSMPTGAHFGLRVYDDLIDETCVTNEEMIQKVTNAYQLSQNLGIEIGAREWVLGTRYHFGDTYGWMLEAEVVKSRIYPATNDGKLTGKPVLLTPEAWEEVKKKQSSTVAAQMLLNPLAGNVAAFDINDLTPYYIRPSLLNVYILVDPSKGANKKSDRTAMAVIAVDTQGNKYLVDGARHRMKLSERWDLLKRLHRRWSKMTGVQSCIVGYERYGMQSDLEVMEEWMRRDKYWMSLEEVSWVNEGSQSKKARVERLEPDIRHGRFFLPGFVWSKDKGGTCLWTIEDGHLALTPMEDPGQFGLKPMALVAAAERRGQGHRIVKPITRKDEDNKPYDVTRALIEELSMFPFAPRDDLVDATSRIYDIGWASPQSLEVEELVETDGYGRIVRSNAAFD